MDNITEYAKQEYAKSVKNLDKLSQPHFLSKRLLKLILSWCFISIIWSPIIIIVIKTSVTNLFVNIPITKEILKYAQMTASVMVYIISAILFFWLLKELGKCSAGYQSKVYKQEMMKKEIIENYLNNSSRL